MKSVFLYRGTPIKDGTFGVLAVPESGVCFYSLERPWENNKPFVSCIPPEEYICKWTYSNHFQRKAYQIMRVPGRYGIRIHPANFVSELFGCISLGKSCGYINLKKVVLDSRKAIKEFETLMDEKDFKLVIRNGCL